jgi:peptidoglycan/LPS O-acetylase OafA/YrhL
MNSEKFPKSLIYRPEIDGLRTLAIVPVILFHINSKLLPGGYLGVDVFFVISGFLITSLLLIDIDSGVSSFKKFWLRRVKRIVPALVTMVFVVAIASLLLLPKSQHHIIGWHGFSSLFSFANITLWQLGDGYWGPQAANSLFLHCWSLSIEEQFYLLFPVLLFFAARLNKKLLLPIAVTGTFASLIFYFIAIIYRPGVAFYLLPSRAWELGFGVCLAMGMTTVRENRVGKFSFVATIIQLIAITAIFSSYLYNKGGNGTAIGSLLPVTGATMLIWSTNNNQSNIVKVLSNKVFVFIGKISYSLYIWHWPVLTICKQLYFQVPMAVQVVVIIGMAVSSYYLIEFPLRKHKGGIAIIGGAVLVTLSLVIYMMNKNGVYDVSMFSHTVEDGLKYDVTPWVEMNYTPPAGVINGDTILQNDDSQSFTRKGVKKNYNEKGAGPDIIVLGDSHIIMLSSLVDTIAKELRLSVLFCGMSGTSPFFKIPFENVTINGIEPKFKKMFDQQVITTISKWHPLVILSARWGRYTLDETANLMDFIHKYNVAVLLIEDFPELYFGSHESAKQYLAFRGFYPEINTNKYMNIKNDALTISSEHVFKMVAKKYDNCTVLPVKDVFLKNNQAWVLDGRNVLWRDADHLSKGRCIQIAPKDS